jgi:hypothetical protein
MSGGGILKAGGKSGEVKKGRASEIQVGLKTWLVRKVVRGGSEARHKNMGSVEEQLMEK